MAGKKRKFDQMHKMTKPELYNKIAAMPNQRDRALAAFIYLTGMRISELLGTMKVIKTFEGKGENRTLISQQKVIIQPLLQDNIEIIKAEDLILVHQVPCLKHRKNIPRRNIPIIISKEYDFAKLFADYYYTILPGHPLFTIKRKRVWQILSKELGIYAHYLIHERCTDLVTYKNFTDSDLKQFRGWSSTAPASIYTHLNYQDIARKMR